MKYLIYIFILSVCIWTIHSTPIRGQWSTLAVANTVTSIPFRITDSQIRVEYNGNIVFGYKLQGNKITTNYISATQSGNKNAKPSLSDLKNCISSFQNYELKGDMIQIKSQDGKLMAQMRKTGDVAPDVQAPSVNTPSTPSTPTPVPTPTPTPTPTPGPIPTPSLPIILPSLPVVIPQPTPTPLPVFQDPGVLKNKWKVHIVKGIPVIFPLQITSNTIQFQFCNKQSLPFTVQNNRRINIQYNLASGNVCENLYPQQADLVRAFSQSTSYDINDYFLYLKNNNDINVFLERIA